MKPAALVLLVAAATAFAGCFGGGLDPAACGPSEAIGIGPEGEVEMTVHVLHDGRPNRDIVVCLRLDENDVLGVPVEGANFVPNVVTPAKGRYTGGEEVRVNAFLLDDDQAATATFPLTPVNVVVVVVEAGYTLRIDKFDEPVAFD